MARHTCKMPHLVAAMIAIGCGGSTPPPENAGDPPLGDEPSAGPGPVAKASSAKVQEGIDAIQAGNFEAAKTALEQAAADHPDDPQAAYYLGVSLDSLGDVEGAVAQYEKALELDPKLSEASVNLSGALLDGGNADRALEIIDQALGQDPKSAGLLTNRALALSAKGDAEGAVDAFKAAVAASPDDAELGFMYAEALAAGGDQPAAIAELQKVSESDDPAVLASTARLFGRLKAFDKCIAALDRALGKKEAAELFVQRGLCKHGKKDEKAALADYEASVAADPNFAAGYFYLGQHKRAAGDKKAAKAALKKAAELDPDGRLGKAAKKTLSKL